MVIPYSAIGIGIAVIFGVWSFIVAETAKARAVIAGVPIAIFLVRSVLPPRGGLVALFAWVIYGIGCIIFLRLNGLESADGPIRLVARGFARRPAGPRRGLVRLDARFFRRHALCHGPGRPDARPGHDQGDGRPPGLADPRRLGRRRAHLRRRGRPLRPAQGADGQHPHLFRLHGGLRLRHGRRHAGRLPHLPRPGHGRRVGQRRRARLRDLAGRASRQGPGHRPELVGGRLCRRRGRHGRSSCPSGAGEGVFFVGVIPAFFTLWIQRRVQEPEIWKTVRAAAPERHEAGFGEIFGRKTAAR